MVEIPADSKWSSGCFFFRNDRRSSGIESLVLEAHAHQLFPFKTYISENTTHNLQEKKELSIGLSLRDKNSSSGLFRLRHRVLKVQARNFQAFKSRGPDFAECQNELAYGTENSILTHDV